MKDTFNILLTIAFLTLIACEKNYLESPSLDVSVDKSTWSVDEPVVFKFSGNTDFITFYSGENGYKLENAARTMEKGTPTIQFTTAFANGTQFESLHLMVSSDFAGVDDSTKTIENIMNATWTDITDRVTLSTGESTSSGTVDLSDFSALNKPVYIAFKYIAESGSIQPKWTISGLTVTNELSDGANYTLANLTAAPVTNYGNSYIYSPGWVASTISNDYEWTVGSTLVIAGATIPSEATESAEAWVLSGPIDLNKVSRDLGKSVKTMDIRVEEYSYTYASAGNYTATFVASTNNVYGIIEEIRQIQIIVNP